jgi:anaerobic selenocysteine-containing dehydrogenase
MDRLSRRDFLKFGAGGIALLSWMSPWRKFSSASALRRGGASVSRTTGRFRKAIPSTCLQCYARCGIIGYNEYGRIVKIGGNPEHPNSRGKLCAKGQAGINYVYDSDRVLYPIKRNGMRGSKNWTRISWEEAYKEVAERLVELRENGHPEQFIFHSSRDITNREFTDRFLNAFGAPTAVNHASLGGLNKEAALRATMGAEVDINDVANSRYILNFGANPYEAHFLYVPLVQRIIESRMNLGTKLVTFDVRLSQTAGKSDEWFPIKPGTDAAVALAMAKVIMEEGLHDEKFLEKWTNYSPDKLLGHVKQFSPEWAEEVSGVKASDVKRIAIEFATAKPATTISGGGVTKHMNGTESERAVFLLNAITGNIDVKGGYCLPRRYELAQPDPVPPPAKLKEANRPLLGHPNIFRHINDGTIEAGALMTYKDNPVYGGPDPKLSIEVLHDERLVPFFVSVDSFINETNVLADLILPEPTYLERWDLETPPSMDMTPFISLRQPIIKPLGESIPFTDIVIELANRVGGGMEEYFRFGTTENYLETVLFQIEKLQDVGGLDYLMEHGVWLDPDSKPDYMAYKGNGVKTPSGRFEIFSDEMASLGSNPMPTYQAISHHQDLKEEDFFLTVFQWNVHTYFQTANCMWLSEIVHDNPIWINHEVAKERGIRMGDRVKITSSIGSITSRAFVTHGIHPKVIAVSDNVGHWEYGRIAQGQRFKSQDPQTRLIWWGKKGNGTHPNFLIPIQGDSIGGGQGWMDTIVRLTKV